MEPKYLLVNQCDSYVCCRTLVQDLVPSINVIHVSAALLWYRIWLLHAGCNFFFIMPSMIPWSLTPVEGLCNAWYSFSECHLVFLGTISSMC